MAQPVPSSAVAGYLPPAAPGAPVPLYGDALLDLFNGFIAGVTGLDVNLVRPRWQADPPNQPAFTVDWIAFGIVSVKGDWNPWLRHDPTLNGGFGGDTFERDEELTLMLSFYGPNALAVQGQYQDGLYVEQNRAVLDANKIKFVGFQDAFMVPALLKEKWVTKVDQRVTFRRRIRRVYPVLQVVGANITLDNEHFITQIVVTP